jgi:hypothetical protein
MHAIYKIAIGIGIAIEGLLKIPNPIPIAMRQKDGSSDIRHKNNAQEIHTISLIRT